MLTNKKGESKTLNPKTGGEILADTCSNVIYVIEDVLQREFVWVIVSQILAGVS